MNNSQNPQQPTTQPEPDNTGDNSVPSNAQQPAANNDNAAAGPQEDTQAQTQINDSNDTSQTPSAPVEPAATTSHPDEAALQAAREAVAAAREVSAQPTETTEAPQQSAPLVENQPQPQAVTDQNKPSDAVESYRIPSMSKPDNNSTQSLQNSTPAADEPIAAQQESVQNAQTEQTDEVQSATDSPGIHTFKRRQHPDAKQTTRQPDVHPDNETYNPVSQPPASLPARKGGGSTIQPQAPDSKASLNSQSFDQVGMTDLPVTEQSQADQISPGATIQPQTPGTETLQGAQPDKPTEAAPSISQNRSETPPITPAVSEAESTTQSTPEEEQSAIDAQATNATQQTNETPQSTLQPQEQVLAPENREPVTPQQTLETTPPQRQEPIEPQAATESPAAQMPATSPDPTQVEQTPQKAVEAPQEDNDQPIQPRPPQATNSEELPQAPVAGADNHTNGESQTSTQQQTPPPSVPDPAATNDAADYQSPNSVPQTTDYSGLLKPAFGNGTIGTPPEAPENRPEAPTAPQTGPGTTQPPASTTSPQVAQNDTFQLPGAGTATNVQPTPTAVPKAGEQPPEATGPEAKPAPTANRKGLGAKVKKGAGKVKQINYKPFVSAAIIGIVIYGIFNSQVILGQMQYLTTPSGGLDAPAGEVDTLAQAGEEEKILIPKLDVDVPVVYDEPSFNEERVQEALERGVVHYGTTALPGENGNNVIVGHSSNNWWDSGKYKFAFILLDKLEEGDQIILHYDETRYVYEVDGKEVVEPTDISVLDQTEDPTLTLITCTPPGTSWQRLVVTAKQISPDPSNNQEASSPLELPSSSLPSDSSDGFFDFLRNLF